MLERMWRVPRRWRLDVKDIASLSISIVALCVSIIALYLNYRTVEEFSFSVGTAIYIPMPDFDKERISINAPKSLAFVNSGNRAIGVLNVSLAILQTKEKEPVNKDCTGSTHIGAAIDPFVVKAGEITIKEFLLAKVKDVDDEGNPLVKMEGGMRRVLWCMVFDLITPESVAEKVYVPILSAEYETPPYGTSDMFFTPSRPIRLLPSR